MKVGHQLRRLPWEGDFPFHSIIASSMHSIGTSYRCITAFTSIEEGSHKVVCVCQQSVVISLVVANKPYGVPIFNEGRNQVSLGHCLTIGDVTKHQNSYEQGDPYHQEIILKYAKKIIAQDSYRCTS